jgi:beta-phosphoglucomutase-like phosphatase (HAD superfamily)
VASPRRVYVDFDDVLCETARGLCELLEEVHGKRVAYRDMLSFDLGVSFGLGRAELLRFMDAAHRPENIGRLRPMEGARAVLSGWRARGLEVCVVTGRPPETAASSSAWLAEHGMPHDRLVFVDKYRRLPPGPDLVPLDALAGMGFAFAIDDAPAMLEYLAEAVPVPLIVFDRPWNTGFTARGRSAPVLRCGSWEEIGRGAEELLAG